MKKQKNKFVLNQENELKIDKLLSRMTLEEKIGQMVQRGSTRNEKRLHAVELIRQGKIGSLLNTGDVSEVNELQRIALEETRLGIPLIIGHDVIHGFQTTFPIPLAQAASWDMKAIEEAEAAAAKEAASMGLRWSFSPMVDISRDPRWGRIAESSGEDTYLGSEIARARVRGFQRPDENGYPTIAACVKHFAGYGAAEGGRDYNTAEISERTLREVYLPPFKAAIEEGCATLMAAFHEISGIPCSGNKHLLRDILIDEWGFEGFVVSDWGSVMELTVHGTSEDLSEAAYQACNAGVHMDMHENTYHQHLLSLVKEGRISEEIINDAVRRILRVKFMLGLFERPYVSEELKYKVNLCKEHIDTALDLSRKSIVLLKNENSLLPLDKGTKGIAVIGPLADSGLAMLGCWPSWGKEANIVTVLQGIRNRLGTDDSIIYSKGCETYENGTEGFTDAVDAALKSDVVIMVLGEDLYYSGENRNRTSLELPGSQQQLLERIYEIGKPVVLLVAGGRPLSITWADKHIPAIVEVWHLGNQAGNAIADVIFGDYNPSGKLPVTFPKTVGQVPVYYNDKITGRPSRQSYADGDTHPLYPFGYGLSYTTFQYSNLKLSSSIMKQDGSITVSAVIKNTGCKDGEEIVQLYVRDIVGSVTRPVKELKGFEKIFLCSGGEAEVNFTIEAEKLGFYGIDNKYIVEPGKFKLWIGPNSIEGLEADFEIV
jgi:beta-glucosidase